MPNRRVVYVALVTLLGVVLLIAGGYATLALPDKGILLALIVLAFFSEYTATVFNRIAFTVGTAFWLAAAALFNPWVAALVAASSALGNVYNQHKQTPLRGAVIRERIGFNIGMFATATVAGGWAYVWLSTQVTGLFGQIVAWAVAAVVALHVNVLILAGIRHIVNGHSLRAVYRDYSWAMPIDLLIGSLGAGYFAAAVQAMGYGGIIIFVLPILLSAYSFNLYARQTQAQMNRLESIVAARTQELSEANTQMRKLARQKDHFLAVLSHDMRTPLTAIRLYGQMLRDNLDLPREKRRHMAQVVLTNELSLTDMVDNILAIEEMRSGVPLQLARAEFDLNEMTLRACATVEGQAAAKQIELTHEIAPGSVPVNGDVRYLQRVVVNLLSNAVKYTPEGGSITVSVAEVDGRALIRVRDTGYGIPPAELPHIFEPFRRVEAHKSKARGSGLGLSIVRYLVEAHGGTVEVESTVDVGSSFSVYLPLAAHPPVADPHPAVNLPLPSGAAASVRPPDSLPSLPNRPLSA